MPRQKRTSWKGSWFWTRDWLRERRDRKAADEHRSCGNGQATSDTLAYKAGMETGLSE